MGETITAVDLFCGVGWGDACASLGIDEHGIDNSEPVATVRQSTGWPTTSEDITTLNPNDWAGCEGLIASPPCQSWSAAGNRKGLDDPRGELVWQPLVWARVIRPRWVVCEQVPEAAEAFRLIADELRLMGYHATVGTLSAEQFGVAQTRNRVVLVAHRDRSVGLPDPTHERYSHRTERGESAGSMFPLEPWVPMAEVLDGCAPWIETNQDSELAGVRQRWGRETAKPSPTLTTQAQRWKLLGSAQRATERSGQQPAPTITTRLHAGNDSGWCVETGQNTSASDGYYRRECVNPAPTVTTRADLWKLHAGIDRPVALTETQGCRLMGFSGELTAAILDLPTKRARWGVIGNAVCPPVAAAILNHTTQ